MCNHVMNSPHFAGKCHSWKSGAIQWRRCGERGSTGCDMSYQPPKSAILREYERKQRPSLLNRLFREHNVYIRTDGGVHHVAIRPWMQAAALGVVTVLGIWAAYATASAVSTSHMLARKDGRLARERAMRKEILARQAADFASRRAELERQIRELKGRLMADQGAWLEKVEALRQDYERLLKRQQVLDRELGRAGLVDTRDRKKGKRTGDGRQGKGSLLRPKSPEPVDGDLRVRFSGTLRTPEEAEAVLDILREMHEQARKRQIVLLEAARKKAELRLAKARAIFRRLKLDPVRIARKARKFPEAQGGPYIPAGNRTGADGEIVRHMDRITDVLAETALLRHELERLPVRRPMTSFRRISSRFGYRSDPFRHRPALHAGIDFKAAYGSPVLATAPGTVVRAGWTGSYGKLVEIRHDNGLVTRYAHLSRIEVHAGQRVRAGERVGRLGNTGRSTGPHLHYEVRLFGKPLNPARFWKARHDIRKIEADS